ncbi:MAG: hypothetical protein HY238_01355 [Acidobacteria bacterium]|nr:hypothetical protein [Acidobacteriota bacterium]
MKASSLWAVAKILFGSGFTVAASYAVGRWFLRATGGWPLFRRGERAVFAFAMGAAWLSNLVFLLCAARLASTWVFGAGAAAATNHCRRRSPNACHGGC